MTPETLEALKGSIEKWRKIVEEDGECGGWTNCPLCALFYKKTYCVGCPVYDATQLDCCEGSPYESWLSVTNFHGGKADTPTKLTAARAELKFLRSLLPKEETGE